MVSSMLIAVATGIDSFLVGLSYGIKGIKMRISIVLLMNIVAAAILGLTMLTGRKLFMLVPAFWGKSVGAFILLILGLVFLAQAFIEFKYPADRNLPRIIGSFRIKTLGLVVQILRQPEKADLNESGAIDAKEALLLGTAVSLDGIAVGFASSLSGLDIFLTPVLCLVFGFILTLLGLNLGKASSERMVLVKIKFLPGLLLILLGLLKFF